MEKLFVNIFHMSSSASYLILVVLLVRFLLRKAPKRMRSFLWLLVGIRLIVPFSVESIFSLVPDTPMVEEYLYQSIQSDSNGTMPVEQAVTQSVPNENVPFEEKDILKSLTVVEICTPIWLAGMVLMFGYLLFSWLWLRNRVKMSVPLEITLENNSKIENVIKIYQSDTLNSPFLFGIVCPRIYIPNSICSEELPYVIRHEMTHRKRKDYLIKPVGFLLLSVYWFNPFVWVAYIMLCKDIELICDECVIRELGTDHKKAYSQALLNSAVNRRVITACPVAFGEVSVKERVKNVLHYKKPAFWILVAAVLTCIVVPVCFMTQKKSENNEFATSKITIDGDYSLFLPSEEFPEQKNLPSLKLSQNGKFTFSYDVLSSYFSYGDYEIENNRLIAVTEDQKYHYQFITTDYGALLFDAQNSSDVLLTDPKQNFNESVVDGSVFVKTDASRLLHEAETLIEKISNDINQDIIMTDQNFQKNIVDMKAMQKQIAAEKSVLQKQLEKLNSQASSKEETALQQDWETTIQRLETSEETLAKLELSMGEWKSAFVAKEAIEQWAQAFCNRDAETIVKFASTEVQEYLLGRELLSQSFDGEKDTASFGWSSPWHWGDTASNYQIVSLTERSAEILYYAWVSDPHVTVWHEILTYKMDKNACIITSETLQFMEGICIAEEYNKAYPNGITGTMMDYYSFNGAGEDLNRNAKENPTSDWYKKLFEPDSAAVFLLNLLNNPNKVGTRVTKSDTDIARCTVTLDFYEDGSSVSVQMLQPYGTDGIWVPSTENSKVSDTASIAPYKITSQNVGEIAREDAIRLEAIFPNHHEFAFDADFLQKADLDGDGIEEQIELVDLKYNGGDGGYALRVTDTKTNEQIPLPDSYREENGFPIFGTYVESDSEKPRLLIQLGEGKQYQTVATIMMDALDLIYDRNLAEFKNVIQNKTSGEKIMADAISGCNVITFQNEETPVVFLKTYVSGFLGHADTLGYVITELRLQKDHTWASRHYFLLDSCGKTVWTHQEIGEATEGNGIITLPFDRNSSVEYVPIKPEE